MITPSVLDESIVNPGLVGFLVVAAMGFALYLLVKSMRKQISRIEVPSEAELRKQPSTTTTATTTTSTAP